MTLKERLEKGHAYVPMDEKGNPVTGERVVGESDWLALKRAYDKAMETSKATEDELIQAMEGTNETVEE